jgi:hypothetical protein
MTIEEELGNEYLKAVEERRTPTEREYAYWTYFNNYQIGKFNYAHFSEVESELYLKIIKTRKEDMKTYG